MCSLRPVVIRQGSTYRLGGGAASRDRATVLGAQLGQCVLSHIGTLLGVLQLVLHLAVLGQIDGSNLLLYGVGRREG